MAENKKAFVLYADLLKTVELLQDDKAGELFKHILRYVNDENPVPSDILIEICFEPIKQQLKRDLKKYEAKRLQWSEAGKKSAEQRALNRLNERSTDSTDVSLRSTDSTVKDTVTVTVKDTVNNKKKKVQRKNEFYNSLLQLSESYNETTVTEFFEYWTESGENDLKMRYEKQTSFDIARRLKTWVKNEKKFSPNGAENLTASEKLKISLGL